MATMACERCREKPGAVSSEVWTYKDYGLWLCRTCENELKRMQPKNRSAISNFYQFDHFYEFVGLPPSYRLPAGLINERYNNLDACDHYAKKYGYRLQYEVPKETLDKYNVNYLFVCLDKDNIGHSIGLNVWGKSQYIMAEVEDNMAYEFDFTRINTREIKQIDEFFRELNTLQDLRLSASTLFLTIKKYTKTALSQVPLKDIYKFITDARTSFYENVDIGMPDR